MVQCLTECGIGTCGRDRLGRGRRREEVPPFRQLHCLGTGPVVRMQGMRDPA
jgi:hypothetical protein